MLIILITFCIVILSLLIIGFHFLYILYYKKRSKRHRCWFFHIVFINSFLLLILEGIVAFDRRLPSKQRAQNVAYQIRYETIQKVLSVDDMPPYDVLKEIMSYNAEIKVERYYLQNQWTSWFASPAIANQPLINWKGLGFDRNEA